MADYVDIDVGSETYTGFADQDMADAYLLGAYHAQAWRDLGTGASATDTKGSLLVTAQRTLDRQRWKGSKVDPAQEHCFPRTGTGLPDDGADPAPEPVIMAMYEIANAILTGSDLQDVQNSSPKIRSLSAGSVSIVYFRGVEVAVRFPNIIQELLRDYLGSSGSRDFGGAVAVGTGQETIFPIDLGYSKGIL